MKHKTRITSLLAYNDVLENLAERHEQVIKAILSFGTDGCNNKMIAAYLELDINSVTGRVNELRKKGKEQIVIYYKKDICPITLENENRKRLTMFWRVRKP